MNTPGPGVVNVCELEKYLIEILVTSFVTPLAAPYSSTLSHKGHDFRKKILNIKCVLIFSTAFV